MINVLHNDYFTESEIKFELACEQALLDVDKALSAYSAICEKAQLDLRQAELECIRESGDMDMLTELYMEADEKTSDKSQNIFQKIWTAIKNFFGRIKAFITGDKGKIDQNDKAQVNKGLADFFKTGLGKIKKFFAAIGNGIKNLGLPKLILAATGIVGLGIGVSKIIKAKKPDANIPDDTEKETNELVTVTGGEVIGYESEVENLTDEATKIADKVSKEEAGDKTLIEIIANIVKAIGNTIKNKWVKIKSYFKSKVGKNGDNGNSSNEAETSDKENNKSDSNEDKEANKEAERQKGIEAGKKAGEECVKSGGVATESKEEITGFYDDDIMFESSEIDGEYDTHDIFAESMNNDLDGIDDLLDDIF